MPRTPIIAANWKSFLDGENAVNFCRKLAKKIYQFDFEIKNEIIIFPAFTDIISIKNVLKDMRSQHIFQCGAQDVSSMPPGAHTGEIPASFIKNLGCNYVLIGHSERRSMYDESIISITSKIKMSINSNMKAILCVGESLQERNNENHIQYTLNQINPIIQALSIEELKNLVIAYEPVWAIGTGKVATAKDAQSMAFAIRDNVSTMFGRQSGDAFNILYGGSVKSSNAREILTQKDINGLLIGSASVNFEEFTRIINILSSNDELI